MAALISKGMYKKFLTYLRSARVTSGMTQGELALRLKATQSFVSKVERGERRLDVLELRSWCKALEINFSSFIRKVDSNLGGDS